MEAFLSPLAARAGVLAKSRRARTISWALAGLLVIFALVGFFAVPPILKSKLEETLSQVLHRPVTVEAVRVNPFAPSVAVRGLSVRERTGMPRSSDSTSSTPTPHGLRFSTWRRWWTRSGW
jgi:hypothetical protein